MTLCPNCESPDAVVEEVCQVCGQEFCPACAAPLAADAGTCTNCGVAFDLFCPSCEQSIAANALFCPHCGETFVEDEEETADVMECPQCAAELYRGDTFCPGCGQPFCFYCGEPIDEEAEQCAACGGVQAFDCPNCGFELLAGTELCPSCNALLYPFCPTCQERVFLTGPHCPTCRQALPVQVREIARVVHTVPGRSANGKHRRLLQLRHLLQPRRRPLPPVPKCRLQRLSAGAGAGRADLPPLWSRYRVRFRYLAASDRWPENVEHHWMVGPYGPDAAAESAAQRFVTCQYVSN